MASGAGMSPGPVPLVWCLLLVSAPHRAATSSGGTAGPGATTAAPPRHVQLDQLDQPAVLDVAGPSPQLADSFPDAPHVPDPLSIAKRSAPAPAWREASHRLAPRALGWGGLGWYTTSRHKANQRFQRSSELPTADKRHIGSVARTVGFRFFGPKRSLASLVRSGQLFGPNFGQKRSLASIARQTDAPGGEKRGLSSIARNRAFEVDDKRSLASMARQGLVFDDAEYDKRGLPSLIRQGQIGIKDREEKRHLSSLAQHGHFFDIYRNGKRTAPLTEEFSPLYPQSDYTVSRDNNQEGPECNCGPSSFSKHSVFPLDVTSYLTQQHPAYNSEELPETLSAASLASLPVLTYPEILSAGEESNDLAGIGGGMGGVSARSRRHVSGVLPEGSWSSGDDANRVAPAPSDRYVQAAARLAGARPPGIRSEDNVGDERREEQAPTELSTSPHHANQDGEQRSSDSGQGTVKNHQERRARQKLPPRKKRSLLNGWQQPVERTNGALAGVLNPEKRHLATLARSHLLPARYHGGLYRYERGHSRAHRSGGGQQ